MSFAGFLRLRLWPGPDKHRDKHQNTSLHHQNGGACPQYGRQCEGGDDGQAGIPLDAAADGAMRMPILYRRAECWVGHQPIVQSF